MPGGGEPGAALAFSIVSPDADADGDVDGCSGLGCVHAHRLKAATHERTRRLNGCFHFTKHGHGACQSIWRSSFLRIVDPDSGLKQTKKIGASARPFRSCSGWPEAREEKYESHRTVTVVMCGSRARRLQRAAARADRRRPSAAPATGSAAIDRTILPLAEPARATYSELDARNAKAPARFRSQGAVRRTERRDCADRRCWLRRAEHVRRAHPARRRWIHSRRRDCASTTSTRRRSARRHETRSRPDATITRVNTGSIMETATAFPGNTGQNPNSVAPLAEMLRLNGYSTGAFGKWHETAAWETSVSGPFDRWPTHQGFDKFYGFIGGETDQWYPLDLRRRRSRSIRRRWRTTTSRST